MNKFTQMGTKLVKMKIAVIAFLVAVGILFIALFTMALAIVFEDDESSAVHLIDGSLLDENLELRVDDSNLEGIASGDEMYMKAQMIYKALEEDPSLIDRLSMQIPAGIIGVLPSNWTPKNVLEVYILFNEVMNNPAVVDNAKFSLDMLFGTFAMEASYGAGYYRANSEVNFFNVIDYDDSPEGSHKGPFQMDEDYFKNDYYYYISKYEDPNLDDSQRFGKYDSGISGNLKLEALRRTNRTQNSYFFADMVAWTVAHWANAIAVKQDTPNKVIEGYDLVGEQQQLIYDFIVDMNHRGSYEVNSLSTSDLDGANKLTNPVINNATALVIAAAKDNLLDSILGYDIGNGRYPIGGLDTREKGNYTGKTVAQMAQELDSCGFGSAWKQIDYSVPWYHADRPAVSTNNPDLPFSALIRVAKGKQAVLHAETLIETWFNELGLSLGNGVVPGHFDETVGVAQGIYVIGGRQMTLEEILAEKGLLNNSQIIELRKDFGTAGHHECGDSVNASSTQSWQSTSRFGVPFYKQTGRYCDCASYRDDTVGTGIILGVDGCHLFMSAYIASALTGRLINPAEISAYYIALNGVNGEGLYLWANATKLMSNLGISMTYSKNGKQSNWWDIIDNTIAQGGLVGIFVGPSPDGLTRSTHFLVITNKLANGNYRIYTSSNFSQTTNEWSRAQIDAAWAGLGARAAILPAVKGNYTLNGTQWVPN